MLIPLPMDGHGEDNRPSCHLDTGSEVTVAAMPTRAVISAASASNSQKELTNAGRAFANGGICGRFFLVR
jgi:hypothetical protein